MIAPIYTVIENTTNSNRVFRFVSGSSVFVAANSTVEVPFEAWSVGGRSQRSELIAASRGGKFKFSLKFKSDNGWVVIPYHPEVVLGDQNVIKQTAEAPKSAFVQDMQQDDQAHIIKATSEDGAKAAAHYGATPTAMDNPLTGHAEGAGLTGFQQDTDTDIVGTKQLLEAEGDKDVDGELTSDSECDDTNTDAGEASADAETSRSGSLDIDVVKTIFTDLVEQKKWDEALNLLIEAFGTDKVTFTARTIMTLKDFDAITTKYNLN